MADANDVLDFWRKAGREKWFGKDAAFDAEIRARFGGLVDQAASGALDAWAKDAEGALALLILLDQFPRNIFRNSPRAFAADPHARRIADIALERGFDKSVEPDMRGFFYLPFMHSENLEDQERCIRLYEKAGDDSGLDYARIHRDIVARFGRFPHRNPALGRPMTAEEEEFLKGDVFKG
ncbi:MAG: hypothetical protein BGP06_09115 [Rhizobiales bacterium 65-9]|nr:DUF924 domain-containing protein [Hyphomicrobiales bacterium]OJY38625.1 MAG: hypothetical protein BGP06_09115 [Rhizobiales bacterium 65-9]